MRKQLTYNNRMGSLIILGIFLFIPYYIQAQTISANTISGCDTMTVNFSFTPSATDTSFEWYFDNGDTSTTSTPPPIFYANPGRYNAFLVVNESDTSNIINIIIGAPPPPNFLVNGDPTTLECSFTVTFEPVDTTRADRTYEWRVEGTQVSAIPEYVHTFNTAGTYEVMLITRDSFCTSISRRDLTVSDILVIPNVFCPSCDEYKTFKIQSNGLDPISIHIFTRTGALVYKDKAPNISWDGRSSSGQEMPPGVYYYIIEYDEVQPKTQIKTGFVHLFRKR